MVEKNNQELNETWIEKLNIRKKANKYITAAAVFALLAPSFSGIAVVSADELNSEEPQTEETTPQEENTDPTPEITDDAGTDEDVDADVDVPEVDVAPEEDVTEAAPTTGETEPQIDGTASNSVDTPATTEDDIEEIEMHNDEISVNQVSGITQENLVYNSQNGRLSLINQVPGTNIAAVLPNGNTVTHTVPYHGTWEPLQTINRRKFYVGDTIEFFTFEGTDRGESIFLTVEGEGEPRPADQRTVLYGRHHFGFRPTERDSRVTYNTEPFFTVEMTFPNGHTETQVANSLGSTSFPFGDNYSPRSGQVFSVRVFDRNDNLLDLTNPDLFLPMSTPNQSQVSVWGDPYYFVTIDPNEGTISEDYEVTRVDEGETFTLAYASTMRLTRPGYDLAGYTVDGTLVDASGNAVTEIDRYSADYTPMSDVTLTPIWEVTTGKFTISMRNTDVEPEEYTIELTSEDGTTYNLPYRNTTTSSAGPISHNYVDDAFPYGTYTLSIDGFNITSASIRGWQMRTQPEIHADGTATVYLLFPENYPANHATLEIEVEPIPVPTYPLGVEVRDLNNSRTDDVGIVVTNDDGEVFTGTFNQYAQWLSDEDLPEGVYTITLTTPDGTFAEINDTVSTQRAVETDERNVFTIELNEENQGNLSRIYGAFRLVEEEIFVVTIDPNEGTINDDYLTTEVEDGEFYNLPIRSRMNLERPGYTLTGYTVTEGTMLDAAGNPVTELPILSRNYIPQSDVTLTANWELTTGGFRVHLYDDSPATQTDRYEVSLLSEDGDEYILTSNSHSRDYRQWQIEDVPNGTYTLQINGFDVSSGEKFGQPDTTSSFVVNDNGTATVDLEFVDNKSTTFIRYRVYGEPTPDIATYPLGIEVRDLNNRRTDDVGIVVTNDDGEVFTGTFNQYTQWLSDEDLPEGVYTITLTTPDGTFAEINDTVATQRAVATDERNVFTIELNEENQGNLSRIYGAFRLVEVPVEVESHPLGIEVRGLDGTRTDDVNIVVTNNDGEVFTGTFNQYLQWLSDEELPVGVYTITLTTPEGTVAEINDTVSTQRAVATDEENVFTILVNAENRGNLSRVYGAFRLVEVPVEVESHPLGIEVRGLDNRRTDDVNIVVTNDDDDVFTGSFNQYLQWLSDEELPVGVYTITLTTPEGTVAEINDTVSTQRAVATDEENVFTILVNAENRGNLSRVYGAFRLVEVDEDIDLSDLLDRIRELEERLAALEAANAELRAELARLRAELAALQADQEAAQDRIDELERRIRELEARVAELEDETAAPDPDDNGDDEEPTDPETPEEDDNGDDNDVEDDDDDEEDIVVISDDLPTTGIAASSIGLGFASILAGLGLLVVNKKRKEDE